MRLSHDDRYQLMREEGLVDRREQRQRTARRAKVNEFLASRSYWAALSWLSAGATGFLPRFFSIGEAQECVRRALRDHRQGLLPLANRDDLKARLVVARYFGMLGREWL